MWAITATDKTGKRHPQQLFMFYGIAEAKRRYREINNLSGKHLEWSICRTK